MTETTGEFAFRALLRGACLALLMSVLQTGSALAATDLSLVHAAKAQDWSEVRALLELKETDVNVAQADGATALAWSVYWNDLDTVKHLLEAGANANAANDYGVSPLHLACQNRSADVVQALLAGGADPNSALWSGVTPLMVAAKSGREDIVRILISAGADVNTVEPRRGQSVLMWAISFGGPEAARVLIEAGADISASTTKLTEDYSPMVLEAYTESVPGTAQGGYTPLMFAAREGDIASARLLLDRGADVNAESVADGSPLVIASAAGHEDLALMLLASGGDHGSTDAGGMTALHFAMRDGLKVLHGYNITEGAVVCNFGGDPTRCKPLAVLSQDELDFLNSPMTDLILDSEEVNRREPMPGRNLHRLANALLDAGADVNAEMNYPPPTMRLARLSMFNLTGATPFFLAAAAQDLEALDMMLVREGVETLIETSINEAIYHEQMNRKADDNEIQANATTFLVTVGLGRKSDFSPAEEARAIQAAQRLIARGADVNGSTATGWTGVHAAAYIGAETVIEFLAANGAYLDATNGCGQTPMSLALGTDVSGLLDRTVPQVETAELLLNLGATRVSGENPVGDCVLGRGGLEADMAQNQLVKDRIAEVERKLKSRQ